MSAKVAAFGLPILFGFALLPASPTRITGAIKSTRLRRRITK